MGGGKEGVILLWGLGGWKWSVKEAVAAAQGHQHNTVLSLSQAAKPQTVTVRKTGKGERK